MCANKAKGTEPPKYLDDAKVLFWLQLSQEHRKNGNAHHFTEGELQADFKKLAIAAYEDNFGRLKVGMYLFYCDEDWKVMNDTLHNSVDEAKKQAEFEYSGTIKDWKQRV